MEKEILFSFVLPAYKDTYFEDAIKSILSQTYINLELIIVDDASPYNLKEIVDKFSDNRISYYRNEKNIGGENLVKQWNHSIEYAKGDYIILAADDDIYSEVFLEESIKLIKEHPEVNIIRGRVQNIDSENKTIRKEIQLSNFLSFDEFLFAERYTLRCIGNYVFKSSALFEKKFKDFPLAWWSDIATVLDVANNYICITPKTVYSFRISQEHISAKQTKDILLKKVFATYLFFSYLNRILYSYKDSDDFIKNELYNRFLKENDMFFKETLQLVRKTSFFDLFSLISSMYHNKIISKKEEYKLFYYYFFRTRI